MKSVKKHTYPPVIMGISLMLTILILLCMMIFSVLALSDAWNDYQYSEKNARRTSDYYEANAAAEDILAEIYSGNISASSASARSADVRITDTGIEYFVPINDSEGLLVILERDFNTPDEYILTSWKQISSETWDADLHLPVLGSD